MEQSVCDHAGLISALGGAAKIAAGIDVLPVTARAWAARNRIPADYWLEVIRYAADAGTVVDADWLMRTTPARGSQRTDKVHGLDHAETDAHSRDASSPGNADAFSARVPA